MKAIAEKTRRRGKDVVVTEEEIEKLRAEWKEMAEKREKRRMAELGEEAAEKEREEAEASRGKETFASSTSSSSILSFADSRSKSREITVGGRRER